MVNNKSGGYQSAETFDLEKKPTRNEMILRGLIRSMSDGVIVLGLNGRVKYINPAVSDILELFEKSKVWEKLRTR